MADDAIFLSTARGEVKVATDLIVDPTFGPVHLLRTVGGAPAEGGGLTNTELRAAPVPVTLPPGGGGLTDTELRAAAVPVSGTFFQATQPVSLAAVPSHPVTGPLTNAELRAIAVPVSGTFWQATQPVSGPVTDAQLRAAAVPVSGPLTDTQLRATAVPISGPLTDAQLRAAAVPVSMGAVSVICRSRVSTFRTPGRAGTAGAKLLTIHNAAGSPIKAYITKVMIDMVQTVVKAITVLPPVIRLYKITVVPTNGTVLAKSKIGGTGASDALVTVRGDSSADGTLSATALTATLIAGAILSQEYASRFITGAGFEMMDRAEFEIGEGIELAAGEGVAVMLDYVLATQNPATDMWIASAEFYEK